MSLSIVDADQVLDLLPVRHCIDVMAEAMVAASYERVQTPLRLAFPTDKNGRALYVMPAASEELGVYGAKLLSLTPQNSDLGLPRIRGSYLLFESERGEPIALIDAAPLTAIRTAAASGLATRLLARLDARTCGIFGTGALAGTHAEAMCAVRSIEEIRVWDRRFDRADAWVRERAEHAGISIVASRDLAEVASSDIICTVTASPEPILKGEWVRPGAHVNLVGAHTLSTREADSALIARARVYVDLWESARSEAGDVMIPIQDGTIPREHIQGEIGRVVSGELTGRASNEDITLYKSLGIAAQDLYAAWYISRQLEITASF